MHADILSDLVGALAGSLGEHDCAARLMDAVERTTGAGIITPDVGGTAMTQEVTRAVVEAIYATNA